LCNDDLPQVVINLLLNFLTTWGTWYQNHHKYRSYWNDCDQFWETPLLFLMFYRRSGAMTVVIVQDRRPRFMQFTLCSSAWMSTSFVTPSFINLKPLCFLGKGYKTAPSFCTVNLKIKFLVRAYIWPNIADWRFCRKKIDCGKEK
jgi:hypothetical protein